MIKKYKKNELNITKENEKFYQEIIVYKDSNFALAKMVAMDNENLEIEYEIKDDYRELKYFRNSFYQERLRLLLNILELLKNQNDYIEWDLKEKNIMVLDNLKPIIIERKIRKENKWTNEEILNITKKMGAFLFLKDSFEYCMNADDKILEKHTILKKFKNIQSLEEIKNIIDELIEKLEKNYRDKEKIVKRRTIQSLKIQRIILIVLATIFIGFSFYFGFYELSFANKELQVVTSYQNKDYTSVIEIIKDENIARIDKTVKYYIAEAAVNVENLADDKKENILNNLSVNADEEIIDYWILIGQGKYEDAYTKALNLEDNDLQEYSLLKEIALIKEDTSLSSAEKEEKIKDQRSKIDTIEKSKAEASSQDDEKTTDNKADQSKK